ncbi:MAG: CDP-alcohol phosphatidyltransferase family protein [Alphaproteobacteria bacterium]|nr:CDP-alcohol phosphatidyltransferase family protein [Alphaproteobacteria bacterium]
MHLLGDSWTHKLARVCVLPLVNTPVTPNHLTAVRLVTGVAACGLFATGDRALELWGTVLWLISAFLDRADGELARVGGKMTKGGKAFDQASDIAIDTLFFLGIGIGLRDGIVGGWSILLGLIAGVAVLVADVLTDRMDDQMAEGDRTFPGFAGFDVDDVFYLFAPVIWLSWHPYLLIGASVGAPAWALYTWYLARRAKRQRAAGPTGAQ